MRKRSSRTETPWLSIESAQRLSRQMVRKKERKIQKSSGGAFQDTTAQADQGKEEGAGGANEVKAFCTRHGLGDGLSAKLNTTPLSLRNLPIAVRRADGPRSLPRLVLPFFNRAARYERCKIACNTNRLGAPCAFPFWPWLFLPCCSACTSGMTCTSMVCSEIAGVAPRCSLSWVPCKQ